MVTVAIVDCEMLVVIDKLARYHFPTFFDNFHFLLQCFISKYYSHILDIFKYLSLQNFQWILGLYHGCYCSPHTNKRFSLLQAEKDHASLYCALSCSLLFEQIQPNVNLSVHEHIMQYSNTKKATWLLKQSRDREVSVVRDKIILF